MPYTDWSKCDLIESVPEKRTGAWVYKNTRMPVSTVFANLAAGASIEEVMEWFDVTREQVVGVLEFAAFMLEAPEHLVAEQRELWEQREVARQRELENAHSV